MLHPGSSFGNSHAQRPLVTFLSGRRIKFQSPHRVGKCLYREAFSTFPVLSLLPFRSSALKSLYSLQKRQCLVTSLGLCLHCFLGTECFPPKNQPILRADRREQRMQFEAVLRQPSPPILLHSLQIPDSSVIVENEKSKRGLLVHATVSSVPRLF